MLKTLSTADLHFPTDKDKQKDFWISADFFLEKAKEIKPDVILISGDLSDRVTLNSDNSGYTRFSDWIESLLNISPIAAIYGTPTHDNSGSLRNFEKIKAKHDFVIIQPGIRYFLNFEQKIKPQKDLNNGDKALILGIPEPNKSWLLSNNENLSSEEATAECIKNLQTLITGYAQIRRDHAELPCFVLFHGTIAGSQISDTQVIPTGGIEITFRDLQEIGADYISMGHIHKRQEFPFIEGGYEGSIYNKTWGELDKKAFSLVEIEKRGFSGSSHDLFKSHADGYEVKRKTIEFPCVPMNKISLNWGDDQFNVKLFQEGKGLKLWLEVKCLKSESTEFTTDQLLDDLINRVGAAPGSRVTKRIKSEETTRAAEIINSKSLFEKFKIWCLSTDLPIPEGAEDACNEFENEIKQAGLSHEPRHFKLDKLILKGAIGIWKGLHKEQIEIDFNAISSGIIALIAGNGKGKSTIIKNCNPYADPIGGESKLQDNFFLRDSESITFWTNTATGEQFKAIKLIDGKNKSGKVEYFLYIKSGSEYVPFDEEQTGRKEGYKSAVNMTFGSVELFKRSAYIAQKNTDLPSTNADRKALFNELLGNDYYKLLSDKAKNRADSINNQIIGKDAKLTATNEALTSYDSVVEEKGILKSYIETLLSEQTDTISRVDFTKLKKDEKEAAVLENEKISNDIKHLNTSIQEKDLKIIECSKQIDNFQTAKNGFSETDELIKRYDQDSVEKKRLEDEKAVLSEKYYSLVAEQNKITDKVNDFERLKKENLSNNGIEITKREMAISRLEDDISSNNAYVEKIKIPCEKCGFISDDINKEITEYEKANIEILDNSLNIQAKLNDFREEKEELLKSVISPEIAESLVKVNHDIIDITEKGKKIKAEIDLIPAYEADKIELAKTIIEESKKADTNIEMLEKQIVELKTSLETVRSEWKVKANLYNSELSKELEALKTEFNLLQEKKNEISLSIERNKTNLTNRIQELVKLDGMRVEADAIKLEISGEKKKAYIWTLLQQAFNFNGIPALELDALAPSISDKANKLLEDAYGSRFEIKINTTKEVGTGKDKKQVECFDIMIIDNEEELEELKEQDIVTLSGGEGVWILKAVYDAFGETREENTGLKYLTAFQDETDGALDPEMKKFFMEMVESGHIKAKRFHTVLVTHDIMVQNSVSEKIVLEEL
jgi:DNA repair exonuclease SbcCD nuclease subunit/DNA repair exonuclease SbcCD ATPase subunit